VQCASEVLEVEHYGKRGVVVPPTMAGLFARKLGNFDEIKNKLATATYKVVPYASLEQDEKESFDSVVDMIAKVTPAIMVTRIEIVEYKDPNMMGQFESETKKVRVARRILKDKVDLLQTLVHEFCHDLGIDGQKRFVFNVEKMLARVAIANLDSQK